MALGLEQMVFDPTLAKPKRELMDCYDFEPDQTSKNVSVFNSIACIVKIFDQRLEDNNEFRSILDYEMC